MRLDQLLYLIEISKCRSMSIASDNLHLTPQAVSMAIKNLEEELNVQLVERTNKGTSLTEKGWLLVKLTEGFLWNIETYITEKPLKEKSETEIKGKYQICSTYGGANLFFPALKTYFIKNHSNVELCLSAMSYNEAYTQVLEHFVPFAFFEQYVVDGKERIEIADPVQFCSFFRYQMFCQVPISFPISKYKSLPLEMIFQYPFLEPAPKNNHSSSILQFIKEKGIPPKIITADSSSMMSAMLNSGLGIAIDIRLPFQDADRFHLKNVKSIPIVDDFAIYFGFIKSKERKMSKKDEIFLEYLENNINDILSFQENFS